MKFTTRLLGAVAVSAMSLSALPAYAEGGTLVIASTQVPRHLNGRPQAGQPRAHDDHVMHKCHCRLRLSRLWCLPVRALRMIVSREKPIPPIRMEWNYYTR